MGMGGNGNQKRTKSPLLRCARSWSLPYRNRPTHCQSIQWQYGVRIAISFSSIRLSCIVTQLLNHYHYTYITNELRNLRRYYRLGNQTQPPTHLACVHKQTSSLTHWTHSARLTRRPVDGKGWMEPTDEHLSSVHAAICTKAASLATATARQKNKWLQTICTSPCAIGMSSKRRPARRHTAL